MSKAAMHPDMQILLDARIGNEARDDSPAEQRRAWTAYTQVTNRSAPSDMAVWDEVIRTPDHDVPVRLYRPAGAAVAAPAIVYMHGGGFMKGDLDSSDSIAWGFAQEAGALVVSVDYRLTPEHPYPAAFDDCWGVLCWLAGNAETLAIDAARIGLAGDSAGGNLAAAIALKARDRGGPVIACAAIVYPGTGLDQDHPSYVEHAEGPGLTTEGTRKYRDYYLPNDPDTKDPYARPVLAEDLSDLPPFWVHSAEIDPIRDDGRVFASRLAISGGQVTYREAKGMIHGFMRARFGSAAAAREYAEICAFLRRHLVDMA
ncbi:MAG: alpha/beta hydrolase [Alphaproteobacteria bacterium]|nr:alpha/beta hydrolase [Alphaproteobacteria bacterium]MDP6812100.1 alpha/beta hydrolase [Alphaproteobacteria bacterium]